MFRDPRGGAHARGIFWGFVLLTVGTANVVTGGLIQAVLSRRSTARSGPRSSAMQNVVAVVVLVAIAWAFGGGSSRSRARLTFNRDAL